MATITGVGGSVTIPAGANTPGQHISFGRWTADETRDVHDITGFDDAGNRRVKLGGMMRLKGTAEGIIEVNVSTTSGTPSFVATNDDGQAVAGFVLQQAPGDTLSFSGRIGNVSPTVDKRGLATCTISFSSSGVITHAA